MNPPACISSKEGVVMGRQTLWLAFRAREEWWWVDKPSGLRFEQGRGGGEWKSPSVTLKHETEVVGRRTLQLAF